MIVGPKFELLQKSHLQGKRPIRALISYYFSVGRLPAECT